MARPAPGEAATRSEAARGVGGELRRAKPANALRLLPAPISLPAHRPPPPTHTPVPSKKEYRQTPKRAPPSKTGAPAPLPRSSAPR